MDRDTRIKRLKFRAWHRGTREADMMIGGYFDARHDRWNDADVDWFESFLEEQDVDIMGWALGTSAVPERWSGAMMNDFVTLDFIQIIK